MLKRIIISLFLVLCLAVISGGTASAYPAYSVSNMHTSQSGVTLKNAGGTQYYIVNPGQTTPAGFSADQFHTGPGWCTSMVDQTNGYQRTVCGGYSGSWASFPYYGHQYLLYSWDA